MFDYNAGVIRAASKKSTNKVITDWSATRDVAHTGYLWNFINYTQAKTYSESMGASYGYDPTSVITHLATGTQWDTTLQWVKNSGKDVTSSILWGNYSNSAAPANVAGFGSIQISSFSELWKANNIYDLAGNTFEWTNEKSLGYFVIRGGSYSTSGATYPAASRSTNGSAATVVDSTFRTALYIL